ncbi:MAG TPA: type II toxin-antitoxin system RelE/ParE family toxin [Steroidobacteraceae bacterium]|nr:type II toxin-antitoxin system RelE/ParE family toxin [Steroidobacteraceae bacterium]
MTWTVIFAPAFEKEFEQLHTAVQDELLAQAMVIEMFGPSAKRPRVDTLKGSKFSNMKELRFDAEDGVWRVAFAFDPHRNAVLLAAGDKSGASERRFYRQLIAHADRRFKTHLDQTSRPARQK